MRRADPVIEFVGLPGSGKSTITRALPQSWPTSRNTDPAPLPLARRLAIYRQGLPFVLSLRPFEMEDLRRLIKLGAELRFYERPAAGPLVIDQGMIQKLWSILFERRGYSRPALERLIAALAPSAADLTVVLGTPPDVAAQRLQARGGGNSRVQKLPLPQMQDSLLRGQHVYEVLIDIYRRHSTGRMLILSGLDPVEVSVDRVMQALSGLQGGHG